jgi:hypothetical protein
VSTAEALGFQVYRRSQEREPATLTLPIPLLPTSTFRLPEEPPPNGFTLSRNPRAALNLRGNPQFIHPTDSNPPADWEFG